MQIQPRFLKLWCFLYFMNEKFIKNAKVEKLTKKVGRGVRLIVIGPFKGMIKEIMVKAILQVLIYKALYDKSYLESKTTMTSGEWTCLISFATAPLTCSERGGSEKFKMKIFVSSGIRTHTLPVHDRKVAAP